MNLADRDGLSAWDWINYYVGKIPIVGTVWNTPKTIHDVYKEVKICKSDAYSTACKDAQYKAASDYWELIPGVAAFDLFQGTAYAPGSAGVTYGPGCNPVTQAPSTSGSQLQPAIGALQGGTIHLQGG